jgi:small-conductance mechanosensitive channel
VRLPNLIKAVFLSHSYNWPIGIGAGAAALAALVAGSQYGSVRGPLHDIIIAYACAAAILVLGVMATTRLSAAIARVGVLEAVPAAGGAVRIITSIVGYLIAAFSILAVLQVSVEKLLVGAGLAGVVLGIGAQQSLGNVFSGIVLVTARPFTIGDHIRIRSGALGGLFDAWVEDMSLTYVTLRTDDGMLKIPNSSIMAAGVLQLTPTSTPLPPLTAPAPPPPPPRAPEGA